MPVMVACLMAFVCLLLSFSISLSVQVGDAASSNDASVQIEVPIRTASDSSTMKRIVTALKEHPSVTHVSVIDHEAMRSLLKPWLGSDIMLGALDIPVLIDVTTRTNTDAVLSELQAISADISVRSKSPWQRDIAHASRLIHLCLLGFSVMLIACLMGMVMLLSRTGLKLHFKTVSLLHLFGATDDYILRQFQRNIMAMVARGAALGAVLAAVTFWLIQQGLQVTQSPLIPSLAVMPAHWMLWLLMPLFVSALAVLTSRFTVQHMLTTMH